MDITGTAGEDILTGSAGNDRIYGLDGRDALHGGEGDDYLVGGGETEMDRSDSLYGDLGNDTLIGGADYDYLYAGEGDDVLEGGSADDYFYPGTGSNLSHGGDGNDDFTLIGGRDTVFGGAGDDTFSWIGDPATGQSVLDGGDGNDIFYSEWASQTAGSSLRITGGAGSDLFYLTGYADPAWTDAYPMPVTLTDFTQGADQINLYFALVYEFPGNPFGALGYMRLEQRGADTVIQFDRDGAAGTANTWYDAAILEGITATNLNRDDFVGYIDPGGSSNGGNETGTDDSDRFEGGPLNDTFHGGGGSDMLAGGAGNDLLEGGDETDPWSGDTLYGGPGNDTVRGGAGADHMDDGQGNDSVEGGDGDDTIRSYDGDDFISGGNGNDLIEGGIGNDTFLGGAGDDVIDGANSDSSSSFGGGDGRDIIYLGSGSDTVSGGAGDDVIYAGAGYAFPDIRNSAATQVDGGDGADLLYLAYNANNRVIAKGGAGTDTFTPFAIFAAVAEITDFTPGLGGDVIDFSSWDPSWNQYLVNPFGQAGYARAVQAGADTVIELDRDGALGTGYAFEQVFVLRGVATTELTVENFAGAAPRTAPPGLRLAGDGDADVLVGSGSADTLEGKAGNDRLEGGADNDRLDGGEGNDLLIGGRGDDTLTGGSGLDRARFEGTFADFEVSATKVTDSRGLGTDTLAGVERLVFDDAHYAFDIDGVAGQAYRLYQAAFNRTPDLAGLGYWIGAGDRGLPLVEMSAMFFQSPEFDALYGASQNNEQLVRLFYVNALHRQPDEPGVAYWTDLLNRGVATPATILTGFSESAENKAATAAIIGDGFKFDPTYY